MPTPLLLPHTAGEIVDIVGDRARILIDGSSTNNLCTTFEAITSPGLGPPLHRHANEDEYFFVCEGTVKFIVNGQTMVGQPGSFAFAPRGSIHTFFNAGSTKSRMLISVTPSGLEIPFRENAALFKRNPNASPKEVEAIFNRAGIEFLGPPIPPS